MQPSNGELTLNSLPIPYECSSLRPHDPALPPTRCNAIIRQDRSPNPTTFNAQLFIINRKQTKE